MPKGPAAKSSAKPAAGRKKTGPGADGPAADKKPRRAFGDEAAAGKKPRRKFGDDDAPKPRRAAASRPFAKPAPTPREMEMKAIINRELPEADEQVKAVQALLLKSTQEMLTLTEALGKIYQELEDTLIAAAQTHSHLTEIIQPLTERIRLARNAVMGLFEEMSFQDLAGQRLNKVEQFLEALTRTLGGRAPAGKKAPAGSRAKAAPRPAGKKTRAGDRPSQLKGPHSAGLDQDDIDRLLKGG
jgi:hypothetical protein